MNQFLLRPLNNLPTVTEVSLAQLRAIPGLRVLRVLAPIAVVLFADSAPELQRLLLSTSWDPTYVRPVPAPGTCNPIRIGPSLEDVLTDFAYERAPPTRAHLTRYLEAYPQFRSDLIDFATGLVLDWLQPYPRDIEASD